MNNLTGFSFALLDFRYSYSKFTRSSATAEIGWVGGHCDVQGH